MATGASAPVAEVIWCIVLARTLDGGAVEGEDYNVSSHSFLCDKRVQCANIDEAMIQPVFYLVGCDETAINGVSMQASFAKIGGGWRLAIST